MFDKNNQRIARKRFLWPQVTRGELMNLTIDFETSGLDRQNVPYATKSYSFTTEYGDALTDFAGNYLNSAQIFPRRPDWLVAQTPALILQRTPTGPADLDDESRIPYSQAWAAISWRIEQAMFAYDQFGHPTNIISIADYDKSFKHGQKDAIETVIDIPLLDDNGEIVYDLRYHPERRKISYRIDRDPQSPYYRVPHNIYYKDKDDKSLWKWVDPSLYVDFYNARFDLPHLRMQLYRTGSDPQDTTFLYARGTPSNKQRKRGHIVDVRHVAYATALYGPQGEQGLNLGRIIDERGRIRNSEALSAYLSSNSNFENPMRLIKQGIFMPDGSLHDPNMDHGAAYDALGTVALRNHCWDIAPWVCAEVVRQSDDNDRRHFLMRQDPVRTIFPLYTLPRRQEGLSHSDQLYWYLGNDNALGDFKDDIFLRVDGKLRHETYKEKLLKDLSVEEWVEYLSLKVTSSDPDRAVRMESHRLAPPAFAFDDVVNYTSQGGKYKSRFKDLSQDIKYITENEQMRERIFSAIALKNEVRRKNAHVPHVKLLEDELPSQYSIEVSFQDDARREEQRQQFIKSGYKGPEIQPGILDTIKNAMDNVYKFQRQIDSASRRLCLKAHPIDFFKDYELDDFAHMQDPDIAAVLQNYTDLCERVYSIYKKKESSYKDFLDEIVNPVTGGSFFKKGRFKAQTVGQAFYFRKELMRRALNDYDILLSYKGSDTHKKSYIEGVVDKKVYSLSHRGKQLFLFADPDNGVQGSQPFLVDEYGRRLELSYIKSISPRDAINLLVNENKWEIRFYRLRSDPTILRLAQRALDLDMGNIIPPAILHMYQADKRNRHLILPNETPTTSRIPTLLTDEIDITRLEIAASSQSPLILERAEDSALSVAARLIKQDESWRILSNSRAYNTEMTSSALSWQPCLSAAMFDPVSNLPYEFIEHLIPRDSSKDFEDDPNIIIIDVPVWHAHYPIEQYDPRLPFRGLVIDDIPKYQRELIRENRRHVVIRVKETGQMFACGRTSLHTVQSNDKSFSSILEKASNDYLQSGHKLSDKKNLLFLGIEKLYPIANTRPIDQSYQSLSLASPQFYGLVSPCFANLRDTFLTAAIVPYDYASQRFMKGDPIHLHEMEGQIFASSNGQRNPNTGHMYESILDDIKGVDENGNKQGITIEQIMRDIRSGDLSSEFVRAAGFLGPDHLEQHLHDWTAARFKSNPDQEKFLLCSFAPVNEVYRETGREKDNKWVYFDGLSVPRAAISWDGQMPPPQSYRRVFV